jgi:hypothetical protein
MGADPLDKRPMQVSPRRHVTSVSVIKCFETDGGVNYRSDRLI